MFIILFNKPRGKILNAKIDQLVINIIKKLSANGDILFIQPKAQENSMSLKTIFEDLIYPNPTINNQGIEEVIIKLYQNKVITPKHLVKYYQQNQTPQEC